ncbi:MAG: NAD(P)/FAD-dependent oxidoreductase [Herpetosiphonaceae bacterium]|nr:NAD(P)/FAD-dependent oxidoreductase [Herpetosiphonaceae bacterium]
MYDLMIVGGGPAALAAAFYAQSKRLNAVIIYDELGGKTAWQHNRSNHEEVNQLPGNEVVEQLVKRVSQPDQHLVHIHDRANDVIPTDKGFAVTTERNGRIYARALIVATGANPKRLDVPGVQHLLGQGLGYSLTTFAHQVAGQRVAVIGATPRTFRGIAEMLGSAQHIYLITPYDGLPESSMTLALHRSPQLDVLTHAKVRDILGFNSARCVVIETGEEIKQIQVDRVFVDLGLQPNTRFVQEIGITDSDGFILVDEFNATSIRGLYAAGDVTTSIFGEQVLIAIGDGVRAAVSAYEYILTEKLHEVAA